MNTSKEPITRFVVIFEHRSGSTYLIEALDSHPDIHAEKEHFARLLQKVQEGKKPESCQVDWANYFYTSPTAAEFSAIGFKTKSRDVLEPDRFAKLLDELNVKVILLQRRNRIKLLVSLFNAIRLKEMTGDWNLYDESHRMQKMEVDLPTFAEWLQRSESGNQHLNEYVAALGRPTFSLFYEEIFDDPGSVFGSVCDFLEVPNRPLNAPTLKNTSDDLTEVVQNYAELRDCYQGTKYELMFD